MPRVSNTPKDVANRFLVKAVALSQLIHEKNETVALIKESSAHPESRVYKIATRAAELVQESIVSEVNSLLGMHQKLITNDMDTFLSFVKSTADEYFVESGDDVEVAKFTTTFDEK